MMTKLPTYKLLLHIFSLKDQSLTDLTSYRHRQYLLESRLLCCLISQILSILGGILILLLAEYQIKYGIEHVQINNITTLKDYFFEDHIFIGQIQRYSYVPNFLTLFAIIFTLLYHRMDIKIYKFDNNVAPHVNCISKTRILGILLELTILSVHPISYMNNLLLYNSPLTYFLLFFRRFYFGRCISLLSSLFSSNSNNDCCIK